MTEACPLRRYCKGCPSSAVPTAALFLYTSFKIFSNSNNTDTLFLKLERYSDKEYVGIAINAGIHYQ
jgi:hypothetical protein